MTLPGRTESDANSTAYAASAACLQGNDMDMEPAPECTGFGAGSAADAAPEGVDVEAGAQLAVLREKLAAMKAELQANQEQHHRDEEQLQTVQEQWQHDKQRHAEELRAEKQKHREVHDVFHKGFQAMLDEIGVLWQASGMLVTQMLQHEQVQQQLGQKKLQPEQLQELNEGLKQQTLTMQMELFALKQQANRLQGFKHAPRKIIQEMERQVSQQLHETQSSLYTRHKELKYMQHQLHEATRCNVDFCVQIQKSDSDGQLLSIASTVQKLAGDPLGREQLVGRVGLLCVTELLQSSQEAVQHKAMQAVCIILNCYAAEPGVLPAGVLLGWKRRLYELTSSISGSVRLEAELAIATMEGGGVGASGGSGGATAASGAGASGVAGEIAGGEAVDAAAPGVEGETTGGDAVGAAAAAADAWLTQSVVGTVGVLLHTP